MSAAVNVRRLEGAERDAWLERAIAARIAMEAAVKAARIHLDEVGR